MSVKILLVLALLFVGSPAVSPIVAQWNLAKQLGVNLDFDITVPYDEFWFEQTLDHFNFDSTRTFQQRYLVSDRNWGKPSMQVPLPSGCPGPILFYTGNEGDITMFWENSGFVTETLAQKFGGLVIFGEHRYYGKTLPFGQESYQSQNLGWLTSEQALADYAALIPELKRKYKAETCPVFAFGGSYGGMLTAWFRLKYPNVVAGGIAASAPILQFYDTVASQWTFNQIITQDFYCAGEVRKTFQRMMTMNNVPGWAQLSSVFNLCPPLQSSSDFNNFLGWLTGGIAYIAMIDYPYPTNFLVPVPAWPANATCDRFVQAWSASNNLLAGLAAGIGIYYNATGSVTCYNIASNPSPGLGDIWNYQACTEMVFPISQNGTSDMFWPAYFNLQSTIQGCQQQYGVTPRPDWIIQHYGGNLLPSGQTNLKGSRIVFSNGELDPWRSGGVNSNVTTQTDLVAVYIEKGAHHLDLRASHPQDPTSVIRAREIHTQYLLKWMKEDLSL